MPQRRATGETRSRAATARQSPPDSGTSAALGNSASADLSVCKAEPMGTLKRIAPIFAVCDLDASMAHYQRLGFETRAYEGGGYAFAIRDGIEIHLGLVPDDARCPGSAYIWVEDADEVAATWRSGGVEVHSPEDTEWGQHEGAVLDPDGNVIRFGSPMRRDDGAEPTRVIGP